MKIVTTPEPDTARRLIRNIARMMRFLPAGGECMRLIQRGHSKDHQRVPRPDERLDMYDERATVVGADFDCRAALGHQALMRLREQWREPKITRLRSLLSAPEAVTGPPRATGPVVRRAQVAPPPGRPHTPGTRARRRPRGGEAGTTSDTTERARTCVTSR